MKFRKRSQFCRRIVRLLFVAAIVATIGACSDSSDDPAAPEEVVSAADYWPLVDLTTWRFDVEAKYYDLGSISTWADSNQIPDLDPGELHASLDRDFGYPPMGPSMQFTNEVAFAGVCEDSSESGGLQFVHVDHAESMPHDALPPVFLISAAQGCLVSDQDALVFRTYPGRDFVYLDSPLETGSTWNWDGAWEYVGRAWQATAVVTSRGPYQAGGVTYPDCIKVFYLFEGSIRAMDSDPPQYYRGSYAYGVNVFARDIGPVFSQTIQVFFDHYLQDGARAIERRAVLAERS